MQPFRTGMVSLALVALAAAGVPPASASELPRTPVRGEVIVRGPAPSIFEQLGRLFEVPVEVDPALTRRRLEVELRDVDFADALRVAARLVNAFWVVQPDGTVLIAPATAEKREEYLAPELRTFRLRGRTSDELTEAATMLRDLLDMRRLRADPPSGTLAAFDTPRRLDVAQALLDQLPVEPAEVWIDALILEVDRERALELGLLVPDPTVILVHLGAGALAVRDADTLLDVVRFLLENNLLPRALSDAALASLLGAAAGADPSQLAALLPPFVLFGGGGTTYAAFLPDTELRLRQLARVTRGWRQLSLRAPAGQESSLFIGERFPIAFTTFSSIFIPAIVQELIEQGQFVPPVPAIRYEELGIRLTVRPQVHSAGEVSLNLKLDQTALTGQEINGIPVLTSRLLEQRVRLRAGETLILSGLRARTREDTRTGVPVLSSLPVLRSLFGQVTPQTRTTELLILLRPRLLRLPAHERVALRTLYIGTEDEFAPVGPPPAAPAPVPAPQRPEQEQPPTGVPVRPPDIPPQPQPQPPQPQPPQPQPED